MTSESSQLPELPEKLQKKLEILKNNLGTEDLESALDKSLNIAHYIVTTVHDQQSKLLIEKNGKYKELTSIA